jgi:hypothetical protein
MKEDLKFWKKAIIKGFVMAGFTLFSIVTTMGWHSAFEPSIVAGGVYIFAEAVKYYNLQPNKKVGNKTYSFLI